MSAFKAVPWEAVMKLFYGFGAGLAEFLHPPVVNDFAMFRDGVLQYPNNWQHFTMYTFFALSGLMDIISQKILERRAGMLESLFVTLAFGVEAHLLLNHRHGKSTLENTTHLLVTIATLGCATASAAEIWNPKVWLLRFIRTGCVLQQATWFIHMAYIIYKPVSGIPWPREDQHTVMFLTMAFCWHMLLNIVITGSTYGIVYACFGSRWRRQYRQVTSLEMVCTKPSDSKIDSNGYRDYVDDADKLLLEKS
ncbi:transmembrane protein 45B-like [Saccoglossus kowalevskii]|uniref:Transmembrane protein 45B-like n=1 Tax=Saccoglossus kowalevskii TaxID=10224 RepID=A0ABM0MV17_SACKO|nr:PREDICTED: transmembrane protein 45B-like [Saccoglossus kowalevskii]